MKSKIAGRGFAAQQVTNMITTDWARAFLTLWVASVVIWVVVVAVLALHDPQVPSLTKSCDLLLEARGNDPVEASNAARVADCQAEWQRGRFYLVGWALGPPLAAGGIALLLIWGMRGFRAGPGNW